MIYIIFPFYPTGKVKISLDWDNKQQTFEDGTNMYVRRRVYPKKQYSFTIGGLDPTPLFELFKAVKGSIDTFEFNYDGATEVVRLADDFSPKIYRENGQIVAYKCDIGLIVEKGKKYSTTTNTLPPPHGITTVSYNWESGKVSLGEKDGYYQKALKEKRTISGTWSGLKRERDLILAMYHTYCRTPVNFHYSGEDMKVYLPDKIEITDLREQQQIVGYSCKMDLEVIEDKEKTTEQKTSEEFKKLLDEYFEAEEKRKKEMRQLNQ